MIQNFKKLQTTDASVNELQENVQSVVKEIQESDLSRIILLTSGIEIADTGFTNLGDPFSLTAGEYIIELGGNLRIEYGTVPSEADGTIQMINVNAQTEALNNPSRIGLPYTRGSELSNNYVECFSLNTTGGTFSVQSAIPTTGGASLVKSVLRPYVKVIRTRI